MPAVVNKSELFTMTNQQEAQHTKMCSNNLSSPLPITNDRLLSIVWEIMKNLSEVSKNEIVPIDFKINAFDRNIAGSIGFVLDEANQRGQGQLNATIETINNIIAKYPENPSQSRFELSRLIFNEVVENALENNENSGIDTKDWKDLLELRLRLFETIRDRNLPCPIGSIGETAPDWYPTIA